MELLFCEDPVFDGRAAQRFWGIGRDAGGPIILDVFNFE